MNSGNGGFGHIIKQMREANGISQASLSSAIGISQKSLSEIETNKRQPRRSTLELIAKALNVTVSDLYKDPEAPPKEQKEMHFTREMVAELVAKAARAAAIQVTGKDPLSVSMSDQELELIRLFGVVDNIARDHVLRLLRSEAEKVNNISRKKTAR